MILRRYSVLTFGRRLCHSRKITSNAPEQEAHAGSSEDDTIVTTKEESVTLIGINRAEKKNSIDIKMTKQLCEALDAFEKDETAEVAILHGIGGNFCAGYDLAELAKANSNSEDGFPQFAALSERGPMKKPTIGAISGYAVGAGFELALMCDLRVVEETSLMAFLNRRIGIPIMCGGTVRLPAIVGYGRAMEMILTGKQITANEAHQWGLANLVVPCGTSLGQAMVMAHTLIKYPQRALLADRMSAYNATFLPGRISDALRFERENSRQILLEDGPKGAQKFVDGFGRHGTAKYIKHLDRSNFPALSDDVL